ncbi:MAG TPA: TIGR01777 family oxidoreductase [Abditibacteriaceae bacterium]|jgi:hypothetical protein
MNTQHTSGTIVIPGGAGYLGRVLSSHFTQRNYAVVILARQPHQDESGVRYCQWDGATIGDWAEGFESATAVINLAGRSVNCRYNEKNKAEIYDSRLRSTRVIGEAIAACARPPAVWINSSSATIYRHALDRDMDEASGEIGSGFSVDVCRQWERVLDEAAAPHTRKVALRSAMVFGRHKGGVMDAFRTLATRGLGGTTGKGNQYVSWIHEEDFARAVEWILRCEALSGPVNCAAPHPLPNAEFMRLLRRAFRRPIGLPAAKWMLEIGAAVLGTETELLLKSRRVVPRKLLQSGFVFRYPHWSEAVQQIAGG